MRSPTRRPLRTSLLTSCAITAASVGLLSGCASSSAPGTEASGSLPSREQAFNRSEVYINQILVAIHQKPTTEFTYTEGPCDETDNSHGAIDLDYVIPGTVSPEQATTASKAVYAAIKQLDYGTPGYQTQPDGVYVNIGSFSVLFDADGGTLGFSVQTCYATPAPTASPGLAGVQQPLTVSPAPTSTAGTQVGVPSSSASG